MPLLKDVLAEVNRDIRALSRMQELLASVDSLQFLADSHGVPCQVNIYRRDGCVAVELDMDVPDVRGVAGPVVVNQLATDPEASDPGETVIETLEQARDRGKMLPPEDLPHVAQDPDHPRAHWTPPNYPPLPPIMTDKLTEADMRMHLVWLYGGEPEQRVIEQDVRIIGELVCGRSHGEIAKELGYARPYITVRVNELLCKDLHTPALIELAHNALIRLRGALRLQDMGKGAA